ncbi:hemerythrin domain-containing protein [Ottowia flava]|uniref:Hemerythrin domain-containing protein n=1 Tax=Ottowia flava TaxID=2675430 RepID=A0ABW4KXP2_9BURK|nr:hemerythrin domain-containing protein [Ottowia sp. GY511]
MIQLIRQLWERSTAPARTEGPANKSPVPNAPKAPSGRSSKARPAAASGVIQVTAPLRTGIRHNRKLRSILHDEHDQLTLQLEIIRTAHEARDYLNTALTLQRFRSGLNAHVLKENVHLYAYLQQYLPHDSEEALLMHEFRREMHGVTRQALAFLKRYDAPGALNADSHEAFAHDVEELAELLAKRIENEERFLYPLYG